MIRGFYWQQDGATPHRASENLQTLHETFGRRVIAKGFPSEFNAGCEWPAYSPDLSAMDFFPRGYTKDKVYKNRPRELEELKTRIKEAMHSIPQEVLVRVKEAFVKRVEKVVETEGKHFENLLH